MRPDEPQVRDAPEDDPANPAAAGGDGDSLGDPRLRILEPDELEPDPDADPADDPDDPDDDPEEEDELDLLDDGPRTVLITGAAGNIGGKLREAWEGDYDLVLLDRRAPAGDPDIFEADLSTWDEAWVEQFQGVDTVIHLAANPDEFSSWEALEGPNLDMLANVLLASALAGVERVVFASSNHAMGGYRELGDMPITEELPPRPGNPYGATKLMGERLGRSLACAFDLTFVALRIGWVQPGENRPDTLPDAWARSIWLSNGDLIRLFDAAVEADLGENQFVVVNGLSNNRGTRWDLRHASEAIGYEPEDDAEDVGDDE